VPAAKHTRQEAEPRRRADAQRNIEGILDAAVEALSEDVDASMTEIARRAGVVRATIYVHYPTRDALLDAVTERSFREIAQIIDEAEPDSDDPVTALRRVTAATWRHIGRYHALVAINTSRETADALRERHGSVLHQLVPLIQRGQDRGAFRADVPPDWHLSMLLALIHAASGEVRAGRLDDDQAETALIETVIGAIAQTS
jgi:AcrR family transcriptional regulator